MVLLFAHKKLHSYVTCDDATIAIMNFDDNLAGKGFMLTSCKHVYTMCTVVYVTKGTLICNKRLPTMVLCTADEKLVIKQPETIELEVNNHDAVKVVVFADAIFNDKKIVIVAIGRVNIVGVCIHSLK